MPRLLLVDDNPSIHKIAETLLAASDVQLISCASGADAMDKVNKGELFDVALLDTSMMGMDGWALLQKLRETASTARMPVAMMAGVLDIVDPEKLRLAPIQGFLKKPVELRDLSDRVKRLLETPVPMPAPSEPPAEPEAPFSTQPSLRVPDALKVSVPEEDLLLLTMEDLFPEEIQEAAVDGLATSAEPAGPEVQEAPAGSMEELGALSLEGEPLDLEELDLEGLRGLTFTSAMDEPAGSDLSEPSPAALAEDPGFTVPEFLLTDTLPEGLEPALDESPAFAADLPDLGAAPAVADHAGSAPADSPADLMSFDDPIDWSDDSDAMVGMALGGQEPAPLAPDSPAMTEMPEVVTLSDILDPPSRMPDAPALDQTDAWLAEIGAGTAGELAAPLLAPEPPAEVPLTPADVWPAESAIDPDAALPALAPVPPTDDSITQADLWPAEPEIEPEAALPAPALAPEPLTDDSITQADLWPAEPEIEPEAALPAPVLAPEPLTEASITQADLWPAEPEIEPEAALPAPALAPEPLTEASIPQADLWPAEPEIEPEAALPALDPEPPAELAIPQADSWLAEFEMAEAPALPAPSLAAEPQVPAGPDPLAALLADPVLMDRLARALVARMGDQVLREIAWEVIPELAERFQPVEKQ